jgi:hypothetical protein
MKKITVFSALLFVLASCNSNTSNSNAANNDTASNAELTNPSAVDTTKHPDGMTNGSVISTDTAAMNVQNSINKAKGAKNR